MILRTSAYHGEVMVKIVLIAVLVLLGFIWPARTQTFNSCERSVFELLIKRFPEWQVLEMCKQPLREATVATRGSARCVSATADCEMPYPAPTGTPCYCNSKLGITPGEIR